MSEGDDREREGPIPSIPTFEMRAQQSKEVPSFQEIILLNFPCCSHSLTLFALQRRFCSFAADESF